MYDVFSSIIFCDVDSDDGGDDDVADFFDDGYDDCVMVIVSDFVTDNNVECFPSTTEWYRR